MFMYFLIRPRYSRPPDIDWSRVMDRPDVRDEPDVRDVRDVPDIADEPDVRDVRDVGDRFDTMNRVTNDIQHSAEDLSMSIERIEWEEGEQANGKTRSMVLSFFYEGKRYEKNFDCEDLDEAVYYAGTRDWLKRHVKVWLKSIHQTESE